MFNAKVYKISVVSLSGMMEEIYATKQTIQQWNQECADHTGKLFMTVDDSQTEDVLIGIVGNRLEYNTAKVGSIRNAEL